MNQLNQIIIEGNLVREPEVKDTAKGTKLATFTIASNRYTRRSNGEFEQEVSYFDCEAWGESANAAANRGRKGCGCRIVGRLKQSRWQGSDGRAYSKICIVCEHLEFLAGSGTEDDSNAVSKSEEPSGRKKNKPFSRSELFQPQGSQEKESQPLPKASGFDIF